MVWLWIIITLVAEVPRFGYFPSYGLSLSPVGLAYGYKPHLQSFTASQCDRFGPYGRVPRVPRQGPPALFGSLLPGDIIHFWRQIGLLLTRFSFISE